MAQRRIKPGTPEYQELERWILPPPRGEGLSVRGAHARAAERGWPCSRGTIENYRREILGQAARNPRELVAEAAAAAAKEPEAPLPELDADPVVNLERQLERVMQHGLATQDPTQMERVCRTVTSTLKALRQFQKERAPSEQPRVLIYLPEERPDPHEADPNDPASWPVGRAA